MTYFAERLTAILMTDVAVLTVDVLVALNIYR